MSVQIQRIVENFPDLVSLVRGSGQTAVSDMRAPENATAESLIFVGSNEHFHSAQSTSATAWVVSQALLNSVPEHVKTVLVSPCVQLSMALIAKRFFPVTRAHQPIRGEKVHPNAVIANSAKIGADCVIGPGAMIGEECQIGEACIIGANAVIEPGVKIGARTHIYPLVFIGHSCEIGAECEIHPHSTIGTEGYGYAQDKQFNHYRITHFGRVIIEDRVHIGAGVQIDRGTFLDSRIGSGTKIDNHCHFGHNIQIGKNTLITGGMITAGSVTIGSYCVFGGRTTIKGHIEVGDKVQVAGLSGIGKSIDKPGEYGGFPLQDIHGEMRTRATLKNLPEIQKQVRRILKHLGLKSEVNE